MKPLAILQRALFIVAFVHPWQGATAQTAPDTWWVQFTDKDATPYSVNEPATFLSPRAIERRQLQGIAIDELDLPVDPAYIDAVLALGDVTLLNRSKWFNAITIRTTDSGVLDAIDGLPFVSVVRGTRTLRAPSPGLEKFEVPDGLGLRGGGGEEYGASFLQIAMMNGHLLHQLDARGEGMLIGVLDSGFEGTDVVPAFGTLRDREGIVLTRDMVDHDGDVYLDHWHGRSVLSCMAGDVSGELLGTAPAADYALVRTEAVAFELLVEEDNWVSGAELLDSLGADIINTSLGYTRFDWEEQDHTYGDLDGQTTRISIATGIAATRGMIPVVSAGNQGSSDWFHISAPADAFGILAVGAVDAEELPAGFSSRGPSADGRVKPDVTAMGSGTIALGVDGLEITGVNGTSFSAPLVAGLVACLWQLHPARSAVDIMHAVRSTASRALDPDAEMGYGIPDFLAAHDLLTITASVVGSGSCCFSVHPVPFADQITININGTFHGQMDVELTDMAGRTLLARTGWMASAGQIVLADPLLNTLPTGLYVLRMTSSLGTQSRTVVKAW